MKRILTLLLIFTFIFSLSSCIAKPTEIPTYTTEPEEIIVDEAPEIPEEEPINAAVFWYNYENYSTSLIYEALNTELKVLDIKFENYDAATSQKTQNEQIDTAISQGTNLLIVNIVDTSDIDAAQKIVDKAKAAEIPVIFFDRWVDETVLKTYDKAIQVVHDSEPTAIAELAEVAAEYVVENYDDIDLNNDGKITYITFRGCSSCNTRTYEAFQLACNEALTEIGKPELVNHNPENTEACEHTDWSESITFEIMETALTKHPMEGDDPIEIVFSNGDGLALGAIKALNNVGWNIDSANSIPVFGFDGVDTACEAIEAGIMTGTTTQSREGMIKAIIELINVLTAEDNTSGNTENEQTIYVPYEIII